MLKTNAIRLLENENIPYQLIIDNSKDKQANGLAVAKNIGKGVNEVYKTLVAEGKVENYVFVIPVNDELDFKKAAKITDEKKIKFVDVKDLMKLTGYTRGGCSPIGMKKLFKTFIQQDCLSLDSIVINAGKIGYYLEVNPHDLPKIIDVEFLDIVKN